MNRDTPVASRAGLINEQAAHCTLLYSFQRYAGTCEIIDRIVYPEISRVQIRSRDFHAMPILKGHHMISQNFIIYLLK